MVRPEPLKAKAGSGLVLEDCIWLEAERELTGSTTKFDERGSWVTLLCFPGLRNEWLQAYWLESKRPIRIVSHQKASPLNTFLDVARKSFFWGILGWEHGTECVPEELDGWGHEQGTCGNVLRRGNTLDGVVQALCQVDRTG